MNCVNNTIAYSAAFPENCFFSIAASPHKGGVWEAALKCMKRYLRKAIGKTAAEYGRIVSNGGPRRGMFELQAIVANVR